MKTNKLRLAVPYYLPYRCYSPACKTLELRRHIHFLSSKEAPCPHCKERGYLQLLAIIHLIQPSQFGIIKASRWAEVHSSPAKRYDFLCEKSKKGFQESAKSPNQPRHYTTEPQSATCFYCLKEYNRTQFPRGTLVTEM